MTSNKILIDSHVFIWLLYDSKRISPEAQKVLSDADKVYLSHVSLWELTLKFNKQQLAYSPKQLLKGAELLNLDRLPIRDQHLLGLTNIKLSHKDPFDALLLAQSESEGCTFMTADKVILSSSYKTVGCWS